MRQSDTLTDILKEHLRLGTRAECNNACYTFDAKQASFTVVAGRLLFGVTQRRGYFWRTECLYIAYL